MRDGKIVNNCEKTPNQQQNKTTPAEGRHHAVSILANHGSDQRKRQIRQTTAAIYQCDTHHCRRQAPRRSLLPHASCLLPSPLMPSSIQQKLYDTILF